MMTRDMIKRTVPATCRRAGLRRVQWHALRHSFASQLAMAGAPLKVIQELMGHATIEMTMRYAHLADAALIDAVGLLDSEKPAALTTARDGQYMGSEEQPGLQLVETK